MSALILGIVLATAGAAPVGSRQGCLLGLPEPRQDKPTWALPLHTPDDAEFKGLELYAWRGLSGEECFALLSGTNYR